MFNIERGEGGQHMARAEDWSEAEFEILLSNPNLSDEELANRLPKRTNGAIRTVRSFIHSFHRGLNISGLPHIMRRRLEQEGWICSKCQGKF